jgi:hypothetical protein
MANIKLSTSADSTNLESGHAMYRRDRENTDAAPIKNEKKPRYLLWGFVYLVLTIIDFVSFLYSAGWPRWLTVCIGTLLAVGWGRWFQHVLEPDVIKLDIKVSNRLNDAER